jgi:hypothetical protein
MNASDTIAGLLSQIDDVLKPPGFKRRGQRWNRSVGNVVDVVTVQRSKSLDRVWINLGVLDAEVYSTCFGRAAPASVDEADCTVHSRLGQSIDGREGLWDPNDPVGNGEIAGLLQTEGLPFLERMHSRPDMERHLERHSPARFAAAPEVVYLAILKALQGDTRGACEELERFRTRALGGWRDDAERLLREYGCEGDT